MEYRPNFGYEIDKNATPKINYSNLPKLERMIAESKAKVEQANKNKSSLVRPDRELNQGVLRDKSRQTEHVIKF